MLVIYTGPRIMWRRRRLVDRKNRFATKKTPDGSEAKHEIEETIKMPRKASKVLNCKQKKIGNNENI